MSEFKYLIFFTTLIIGVPVGFLLAQKFKFIEKAVFFLFIFFTCEMVDINFVSMETYRGTSKGFEFGMVDISMLIMLLLVIARSRRYPIECFPPGSFLFFVYFILSLISIINADIYIYSAFEVNKMFRMYLYFWIAYNYLHKEEHFESLAICFGIIITYIFLTVVEQKYVQGVFQNRGPFPHQNSLVMYMGFLGSVALSRVLNKTSIWVPLWFLLFGMAAFCILSTLSRAGLALFSLNCTIVFLISLILRDRIQRKLNRRKLIIVLVVPFFAGAVLLKASDSIIERFTTAPEESTITRILLAQAAIKMANENIFGIGLNNFAHKINDPYPYGSHIPSTISSDSDARGLVETSYLMIAAETGWPNLVVFLFFLFYFYFKNIANIFRLRHSDIRYLSVAILAVLTQVYLQSTLEWVLKQTNNFYQLMFIFSIISAMTRFAKLNPPKPISSKYSPSKYSPSKSNPSTSNRPISN